MHNRFKPILPAPVVPRPGAEGQHSSPIPGGGATLRSRRAAVRVACNGCRTKRTACDGNRPTCNQCLKRGSACVYVSANSSETPIMSLKRELEVLKKNQHSLTETIHILRSSPEDTSVSMLKRLRSLSVSDPASVLSVVKGQDAPGQAVPRHVLSRAPPQDGREFELMLRHALAYPALVPLDASAVSMTAFTIPSYSTGPQSTPDLAPDPPSASSSRSSQKMPEAPHPGLSRPSPSPAYKSSSSSAGTPTLPSAPTSGLPGSPFLASLPLSPEYMEYCDERLNLLEIGYWIRTEVSNPTAAALISLYLRMDHPILGAFNSSLFLDDLIARRTRFCSPLLVCSMLVWAQLAYGSLVSDLEGDFADRLVSEATALWKYEQHMDSLPTIAAAQFLGLNCIYSGVDAGLPYIEVANQMAQRLGLFGPGRSSLAAVAVGHANEMDEDEWTQAAAQTAWGLYNFLSMHAFNFQRYEPFLDYPPLLDIPGGMSHTSGNEALTDGDVAPDLPDYMGRTFPALCMFWVLNKEWMSAYYSPFQAPVPGRVSWSFAQKTFDNLLNWSDNLHFRLARGDQAVHHIYILHILFHSVVLELYRPFAARFSGHERLDLDEGDAAIADAIFNASVHQLKHIIIIFKYTCPCAPYIAHCHVALLQVANIVLEDKDDHQWRDYFALCVNAYADLVDSFPVAEGIVRGLLSMGLRDGTISAHEAQGFLHRVRGRCSRPHYGTPTSSTIVVDLKLAVTDRNAAQLKSMADMFESLSLFDQFINPDTDGREGVEGFQSVVSSPRTGGV